ncbi:MAG: hypothetical protein ACO1RT_18025 [Planctomycetaceae bacterium]
MSPRRILSTTSLMRQRSRRSLRIVAGLLAAMLVATGRPAQSHEAHDTFAVAIKSTELTESSGLAASNRSPGHFWTHNDSGDGARLFAVNTQGSVTGSLVLEGANAIDWEDMASFVDQGTRWLLIGDIGDNQSKRPEVTLYLLDEPDPQQHTRTKSFRTITLRYPDGPCDGESIAVDLRHRMVWLVGKRIFPHAPVHSLPLPEGGINTGSAQESLMLTRQGTLAVPMITGMDIDPHTGDVLLVNYLQSIRYSGNPNASAGAWLTQTPEVTELPKLPQVEAVAIDAEGYVWVTSEGSPAKLVRLPLSRRNGIEVTP